jgi:hypothetical protein
MTDSTPTPEGKFAGFELIRVTNGNDFPITDMYDGVPYLFAPGKPISIPVAAAQHFFAWPTDDPKLFSMWVSKRHGWNTKADLELQTDGRMRWQHWAEKISIEAVQYDLVQRDPAAPIPADDGVVDPERPPPMPEDEGLSSTRGGTGTNRLPRRVDV